MSNFTIHLDRNDEFVDALEMLEALSLQPEDVVHIEAPVAHEIFSHPQFFRIIIHRWPRVKYVAVGQDGIPKRLAAGLGVVYISATGGLPDPQDETLLSHNFTFSEYLSYEIRKKFKTLFRPFSSQKKTFSFAHYLLPGVLVFFGFLLFWFVGSYIFIPKTLITLRPQTTTKTIGTNIVFSADSDQFLSRSIAVRVLEQPFSLKQIFSVNGVDEKAMPRAKGKIRITNTSGKDIQLRPSTRFVSPEGIVFRISDWMTVSASGGTQALVIADALDAQGNPYGERGNVATGTVFSLPGLADLKTEVWAEAITPFTGGSLARVPLLTDKEIAISQGILRQKLEIAAREKIEQDLREKNTKDTIASWALLPLPQAFEIRDFTGSVSEKPGAHVSQFTAEGSAKIRTLIFDKNAVEVYVKQFLFDHLFSQQETFVKFQSQSLRIPFIFSQQQAPFRARVTIEMDAVMKTTLYDFFSSGNRVIRQEIAGKSFQDALSFLSRNPEVASVKITHTPFWDTHISAPENIQFILE